MISTEQQEVFSIEFTEQIAPYIQKYAPRYGIRVCSPILAQAILESASGTSELARNANNYFGLKYRAGRCPTACGVYHKAGFEQNPDGSCTASPMQWMKFPDMEKGVQGYFDFINIPNYSNLRGIADPETYLENIKKDGYATSLNYVKNLMSLIRRDNLTKYDAQQEAAEPMTLIIHKLMANPANYGGSRKASAIRYLIYHYTANQTDTARANASYFRNQIVKASAHYFVDGQDIYQSVEDLKTAYSVGGSKWSDCGLTKGGSMYGQITNANSISIEMCSVGGVITEAAIENAVALGKELLIKYNIPLSNVYRHFDVNGKHCPGWKGWYGSDCSRWTDLKNRLADASCKNEPNGNSGSSHADSTPGSSSSSNTGSSHADSTPGSSSSSNTGSSHADSTPGSSSSGRPGSSHADSTPGSSSSGRPGSSHADSTPGNSPSDRPGSSHADSTPGSSSSSRPGSGTYQVRLLENLNIRRTPNGTISQINGARKGFIYTIVETQGSWGRLKSGAGWISVSEKYVAKLADPASALS